MLLREQLNLKDKEIQKYYKWFHDEKRNLII